MAGGQNVTLEFLQGLSDSGRTKELQSAMAWCSTKDLRSFCGGMGVRVRSKAYAAYHTKAGYSELLAQLLRAKSASKGLAVGAELSPIVVTPVERTRKTKNCNLRLLNVLFSDELAPILSEMNAHTELTSGGAGGSNIFWIRFREEFVSSKPVYSHVPFHETCFTGFDLSTPVPHSSSKLSEMWSELWGAYNSALIRLTHSMDAQVKFVDCCPSRSDVLYMRCWLNVKPGLLSEICAKLPASVGLVSASLPPSVTGCEGVADVGRERASLEHPPPSRKRSRSVVGQLACVVEPVASTGIFRKDAERAFLMQSIRHAVEIVATARELELGREVEETVRLELQQCTRRLRRIQQEELEDDDAQDEEEKEGH